MNKRLLYLKSLCKTLLQRAQQSEKWDLTPPFSRWLFCECWDWVSSCERSQTCLWHPLGPMDAMQFWRHISLWIPQPFSLFHACQVCVLSWFAREIWLTLFLLDPASLRPSPIRSMCVYILSQSFPPSPLLVIVLCQEKKRRKWWSQNTQCVSNEMMVDAEYRGII